VGAYGGVSDCKRAKSLYSGNTALTQSLEQRDYLFSFLLDLLNIFDYNVINCANFLIVKGQIL